MRSPCSHPTNFGAPAVAQRVAVNAQDAANAEDQTAQSLRRTRSGQPTPKPVSSCRSIRARRPEPSSSIRANVISISCSRRGWLSVTVSASDVSVFQWSGVERVSQKQEWPDWRVPAEMIGRQPYLPRFMAGGPGNPLGARALYLGHTVFRIHGTNQPETIGHAVSSGCIRLDNADVIDLYDRVQVGAKVLVKQSAHGPDAADAVRADEARNERMSMRRLVKSRTMNPIVAKSEIHAMN